MVEGKERNRDFSECESGNVDIIYDLNIHFHLDHSTSHLGSPCVHQAMERGWGWLLRKDIFSTSLNTNKIARDLCREFYFLNEKKICYKKSAIKKITIKNKYKKICYKKSSIKKICYKFFCY